MNQKTRKRVTIGALGDVVSTEELASLLGVAPKMVYCVVKKGGIPSFRFGKYRMFLKKDILSFIGYEAPTIEAKSEMTIDEAVRRESPVVIGEEISPGVTMVPEEPTRSKYHMGSGKGGSGI